MKLVPCERVQKKTQKGMRVDGHKHALTRGTFWSEVLPEKKGKSAVEWSLGNVAAGRGGHGSSNGTAVRQFLLPCLDDFTCMPRSRENQGSGGHTSGQ